MWLQIEEIINPGAFLVGFFTPGETKWRLRNVAIAASGLNVRGFLHGFSGPTRFSYIRFSDFIF